MFGSFRDIATLSIPALVVPNIVPGTCFTPTINGASEAQILALAAIVFCAGLLPQ